MVLTIWLQWPDLTCGNHQPKGAPMTWRLVTMRRIAAPSGPASADPTLPPVRVLRLPLCARPICLASQQHCLRVNKCWRYLWRKCEKLWIVKWIYDINGCTKLNLDLNLDKFDTFTWPEGLRWSSSAGMTLEILRVLEFLRLSFSSQGTLKDCANASNASNASRFSSSLQWAAGPHRTLAGQPGEARKTLRRPLRPFQHIYSYIYIHYKPCASSCANKIHAEVSKIQYCNDYQWLSMTIDGFQLSAG